jgi:hypothetical protein
VMDIINKLSLSNVVDNAFNNWIMGQIIEFF